MFLRPSERRLLVLLSLLPALACRADEAARLAATEERERALQARVEALAEARLRALFPEVEGELSREAITRAVATRVAGDAERSGGEVRSATLAAVESGEFERARALLGELLAADHLARAEERLAASDPRGALAALDLAVETAPHSPAILVRRAQVEVLLAEGGDRALLETALGDYLAAAAEIPSAQAWLGASRLARTLGRGAESLAHARRAAEITLAGGAPALELAVDRALAEASLERTLATREGFEESERVLERLVGRTPEDAWAWRGLAALYEAAGRLEDALARTRLGLALDRRDAGLHERLVRIAFALRGHPGVLAEYEALARVAPGDARVEWQLASTRFELALLDLAARRDAEPRLRSAEAGFARTRELEPGRAIACREHEAMCRLGLGWSALARGDLDGARTAFLSAEEARPGGLDLEVAGQLGSGVAGLEAVGRAYAARPSANPNDLEAIEDVERAARTYARLHEHQPEKVEWAARAGELDREAAVALELKGRALGAQGKLAEANQLLDRARRGMERSYAAFADAVRLSPADARLANEAGSILARYLQRDAGAAEHYLSRAVELLLSQLAALRAAAAEPGLGKDERERRETALEKALIALGDAYSNLGFVYLDLKEDPLGARAWLEKSARTGPDPREEITGPGGLLAQCDALQKGGRNPKARERTRWASPITPERKP